MDVSAQQTMRELVEASPPLRKTPKVMHLYLLLLPALLTSSAWGFDISMTNGLQSITEFSQQFDDPTGSRLGFYGASSSVGGVLAVLLCPLFVDRFGRRWLVFVGAVIVAAMGIVETFSTTFYMFAVAKLFLGFGSNVQQIGAPTLVVELAHPKQRQTIASLYNTSLYIGLIIGAWIAYGTAGLSSDWSWKIPCILQITLPCYQILAIWLCPESPRWLASKGRVTEATNILVKYHGAGKQTDLVRYEIQEILAGLEADKTQLRWNREGLRSVFSSRGSLHRLWICAVTAIASQCAGSTLISTYLPVILEQVGFSTAKDKTLINGLINIASWLSSLAAAYVIPRVKRRSVFLSATSAMFIIFIVWTALAAEYTKTKSQSIGIGVVAMVFLFNMVYCACWLPLVVAYPLEVVTTKQRGLFFCWTYFCINASSTAVGYINPIGLENISWRYYIIQTIFILVLLAIIYFTFVETQNLTLEEIAVLFDGHEDFSGAMTRVADVQVGNIACTGQDQMVKEQQVDHVQDVKEKYN